MRREFRQDLRPIGGDEHDGTTVDMLTSHEAPQSRQDGPTEGPLKEWFPDEGIAQGQQNPHDFHDYLRPHGN